MTEPVLPPADQAALLAVGPDSVTWRYAGDARGMLGAGAALMLQVAHPTVGAGVREHSNFAADPWGRLMRTLDFVNLLVYGGPEASVRTAARVRAMHRQIKGTTPDGRRYHALEPEAYAWVHATLAEAIVKANQRFARPMRPDQLETFWSEWRGLGRLLGVRDRDLPEGWAAFQDYVAETIATTLEDNDVVQEVYTTLNAPTAPPLPLLGPRLWGVARRPAARAGRLATVGLLPPDLRRRLHLPWTRANESELRALGAVLRSTTPLLPRSVRIMGPGYLRMRSKAIARGAYGEPPSTVATDARPAAAA